MELANIIKIEYKTLGYEKFDVFLAALDNQMRCHFLAQNIKAEYAEKIFFATNGFDHDQGKIKNGNTFANLGFRPVYIAANQTDALQSFIEKLCNRHHADHMNLLIDYSCMPKNWYAAVIDGITRMSSRLRTLSAYLSYTPKKCLQSQRNHGIEYLGPILTKRDSLKNTTARPIAMIAGLDSNYQSMSALIHQVKPQKIIAFIPECLHNPDYTDVVMEANKPILDKLDEHHIIKYKIDNPEEINSMLTSYCLQLRLDSEVMIVPQGPKIFFMVSLLLSLRYPDIKLWEIIGKKAKPKRLEDFSSIHPVVVKVNFCEDLEDLED